jgi:hypothetical protein
MSQGGIPLSPSWEEQFRQALAEWRTALDGFNYADADFIDYQVLRLYAAEQKLAVILRQVRKARQLERARALAGGRLPSLPDVLTDAHQLTEPTGLGPADGNVLGPPADFEEPGAVEERDNLQHLV